MKKKVLALLTVLVMALGIMAVPNTVALATWDDALKAYDCVNCWWGGPTNIVCYVAESGTIGEMETSKGYHPGETGFAYWTSVVLELQENGSYVVKEIIPADGSNTKLDIALTEGKLVINYHADATKQDWVAFYNSLKVGDVLAADINYDTLAAVSEVATFSKVGKQGNIDLANGIGDATTVGTLIAALAPNNANATIEVLTTGTEFVGLPYWYTIILEKNAESGAWVVKAADLVSTDGVNSCKDEPLGEGRMAIVIHDAVANKEAAAYFKLTATVGQEYYLVGEIPAYGTDTPAAGVALDGVYLTTEKPAEPEPTPTPTPDEPGDEITPAGDFDTMATTALMMVSVALVGVVLVLKKRNNVA